MPKHYTKESKLAMKVAANIGKERTKKGMNRIELAEMIGVTHQQLQKYELGTNNISIAMLDKISQALDVPISVLLFDDCWKHKRPRHTQDFIKQYNQLPTKTQDAIVSLTRSLIEQGTAK